MDRFRSSGGDLAYENLGGGEALVLLHGFPQSSFVWRDLAPLFAARFRVIVPDLLGAGESEKPSDVPLGISAQAGYVRELLDGIGVERYAVVGHGVGGGVGQVLALEDPRVGGLVLLDTITSDRWPAAATRELQATTADREEPALVEASVRATLLGGVGHPERMTEEVVARYLRPWLSTEGVPAFFRAARSLDGRGLVGREREMSSWDLPVLVLWGEDDPFLPVTDAEALLDAVPASSVGILPGCGHFLVDDAAETIGPMILEYLRARFLQLPHGHGSDGGAVMLQLERRPPWVDLAEYEQEDDEPAIPDPATQEVGPTPAADREEAT